MGEIVAALGDCSVDPVPVPHDCVDGFLAAFWRRPEIYLDPRVRAGMSGFALLDQNTVARGVERLNRDLESGAWEERFGYLRSLDVLDAGYRLLSTRSGPGIRDPGPGTRDPGSGIRDPGSGIRDPKRSVRLSRTSRRGG